ncbi:MAG: hypothetical protein IIW10_06895 [Spirochaetaceae bacterium]|nr:hypothetical protein [Spirochaetaceae bacterium]
MKRNLCFLVFLVLAGLVFSQTYTENLENGGFFSWENELPLRIDQQDMRYLIPLVENKTDAITIKSNLKETKSSSESPTMQIVIEITGKNRVETLYNMKTRELQLESQIYMLTSINDYLTTLISRMQGDHAMSLLTSYRTFLLRYKTVTGTLEINAGIQRGGGGPVNFYYPLKINILGKNADIYPDLIDGGQNKITLGTVYNSQTKKHFHAYYVCYFFNDYTALKDVPPPDEKFMKF